MVLPAAGISVMLVVAPSASAGCARDVAVVRTATAVAICAYEIVSPIPLFSAPSVAELKVTLPLLLTTFAVTLPLPRSPEPAVAAITEASPTLTAGTEKAIWLMVALAAMLVPVPTCRKSTFGMMIWKSRRAVAVIGEPGPVVKFDSALAANGAARARATALLITILLKFVFMFGL